MIGEKNMNHTHTHTQTVCCVLGGDGRKSIYGRTPMGVGGPEDFTWSN